MPATSEARVRANRQNSLKSTGPKTTEGKARSRRNGLKHGLTGSGKVLTEADANEVEARSGALMAELDPCSLLGRVLVGQIATLSVRMERGARQEEATLEIRVRHAPEVFDRERVDRAEQVFRSIADDPRLILRELKSFPEGVDRMVEAWQGMRANLTRPHRPGWGIQHRDLAANLIGLRVQDVRDSKFDSLTDLACGSAPRPIHPETATMEREERQVWARARLLEAVDEELARLEAHRATLDLEAVELDRIASVDVALFDPSQEAALARRYEAEARRGFFRALGEFRRVEAEAEAKAEEASTEEAKAEEAEAPQALASSWDDAIGGASPAGPESSGRPRTAVPGRWMGRLGGSTGDFWRSAGPSSCPVEPSRAIERRWPGSGCARGIPAPRFPVRRQLSSRRRNTAHRRSDSTVFSHSGSGGSDLTGSQGNLAARSYFSARRE